MADLWFANEDSFIRQFNHLYCSKRQEIVLSLIIFLIVVHRHECHVDADEVGHVVAFRVKFLLFELEEKVSNQLIFTSMRCKFLLGSSKFGNRFATHNGWIHVASDQDGVHYVLACSRIDEVNKFTFLFWRKMSLEGFRREISVFDQTVNVCLSHGFHVII